MEFTFPSGKMNRGTSSTLAGGGWISSPFRRVDRGGCYLSRPGRAEGGFPLAFQNLLEIFHSIGGTGTMTRREARFQLNGPEGPP